MKILSIILLIICFTTQSFGQTAIETKKSRIKELIIKSFDEIWSELNSKKMDKYYSKDFLLLENGEVWNNDSISNYLDKAVIKKPIRKRVNAIDIIEIKVSKKTAWVAYRNSATFSIDNKIVRKAHWLESASAILTEAGWKLQMLHSTVIKNE